MRVLVVEDDPSVALMERTALQDEGYEVAIAEQGSEAIDLLESWKPDVVLLDRGLPDMEGNEVITRMRATSRVPIVVVTGRSAEDEVVSSLDLGADDYVVKPFKVTELMARVRAVMRRAAKPAGKAGALEFKDIVVDSRSRKVSKGGRGIGLTRIEYDILEMLLRRLGEVVDRDELASAIWNLPAARIGKSLDVHMSVLRRKLGDDPREPSYIITVRSVGFRLATD